MHMQTNAAEYMVKLALWV